MNTLIDEDILDIKLNANFLSNSPNTESMTYFHYTIMGVQWNMSDKHSITPACLPKKY